MVQTSWKIFATSIKNQGNCGSCCAHAICACWESLIRILEGNPEKYVDLSESDLFRGCGGSCYWGTSVEKALNRAVEGVVEELCLPYQPVDNEYGRGRCSNAERNMRHLQGWVKLEGKEEVLKALENGPLVTVIDVRQSFINYKSGIYENQGESDKYIGHHAVAVFGYNSEEDALLIKNSWNTDWGEEGWGWIKYGDSNICRETWALYASQEEPESPWRNPWTVIIDLLRRIFNLK